MSLESLRNARSGLADQHSCSTASRTQQQCCAIEPTIVPDFISRTPATNTISPFSRGLLTVLAAAILSPPFTLPAHAENELAAVVGDSARPDLVKPQCFAQSCKTEVESCAQNGDCIKGLACAAKCLGDSQCTVGCFARYNNPTLERVLQCSIEDASCIQIASVAPGADSPSEVPRPPAALVKATPATMQGKWYKVIGFNPNYDCFECQRNSFAVTTSEAKRMVGTQKSVEVGPHSAIVEVEYAMPRERVGELPQTYHSTLTEKLEFDTEQGSRRTAHTEGRMFGLTFWENWYLIGKENGNEPEFRFVYYTGKTLQNRYEGAFVYSRTPQLPEKAMPSIYKIARQAGFDPTKACCIDNRCFDQPAEQLAQPPLFTPIASANVIAPEAQTISNRAVHSDSWQPLKSLRRDIAEIIEDPKPLAAKMFTSQRKMFEVREFDANGYRVPSTGYANGLL